MIDTRSCDVNSRMTLGARPSRSSGDRRAIRRFLRPGATALALAAVLAVSALAAAACGPAATPTAPLYTEVPIGPTPWPSGTTGHYGLHIDPSLLARLPKSVDAYPIVEDPDSDSAAMDDPNLATTFDGYAAARIGEPADDNWLVLAIGHFKPVLPSPGESDSPDLLESWVADYAAGACSQANGVASTNQETINFWIVDTATCAGGPVVYTLSLGKGVVLSMFDLGPRDLGRKLIQAIYT
jgi:hypothetical protein